MSKDKAYKKWDYYRSHLKDYKSFRKHVKALSHKKNKQVIEIDVVDAQNAIWDLGTSKLYYWILKLLEEGLIYAVHFEPKPIKNMHHHANAEVYQCVIYISVTPKEQ